MEGASTSSNLELVKNVVGRGELPMVIHLQQEPEDKLPILKRMQQEYQRCDRDERKLWMEIKKLKQQEQKMLQDERMIQNQLSFSKHERYKLEIQAAEATHQSCINVKLRATFGKAQLGFDGLGKLDSDLMVLRSYSPHKAQTNVAENEKQIQGNDHAKCDEKMSSSSQDLRLENRTLRALMEVRETTITGLNEKIEAQQTIITGLNEKTEAQETTITSLNKTFRGLSSLDKLHGRLALTNERNPMLSKEMDDPENHNFTAGAQETKINTQSGEHASHTLKNALTGKGSGGMILESKF
ncbi:uncharacterized protein VP01_2321g6 [Puccinia sorghi]|uniref:Uncharacterized protein n=1 Tax=Puccinia sorghi TaxID=27349 RepID=A0A0L6V7K0_9BASI|nr:uncharacterized protein VP01_2321g6 [Puccinia sorghi]